MIGAGVQTVAQWRETEILLPTEVTLPFSLTL